MTREEIERAISNVKATLAVEGLEPSELAIELGRKMLMGEITSEEAINKIKEVIKWKKQQC
jgi:hypothetical protein